MDREQELSKLLNVLHRTGRMAMRTHWMGGGEESARFCVEQYNRILNRLRELEPNLGSIFTPLEPTASLHVVALACRQVVSYFEDELRQRGWRGDARGWEAGFGVGDFAQFQAASLGDLEELGNMIRDWVQGWKCGPRAGRRPDPAGAPPKSEPTTP